MVKYVVTGYIHKRDQTYTGKGSSERMVYEEWLDEPRARQRVQDLVEVGPCLWATYERREQEDK